MSTDGFWVPAASISPVRGESTADNFLEGPPFFTGQGILTHFLLDWADYDNNGIMNILDLVALARVFLGADAYWDLNLDGNVNVTELALVGANFLRSFDTPSYPGAGHPRGMMDPMWRDFCGFLPYPQSGYCNARI